MSRLKGKKLLIIGGAFQHCKLVEAAKELGVITYVTDYLPIESAPAKQIADHYFMHDISDIDAIVKVCISEGIDGVISTSLDACQRPYYQICKKLNFPCFGTEEQFSVLTDKILFKKFCKKIGLGVIPEYSLADFSSEEICKGNVEFPVLIKPCDSRGSRGQVICYSYDEIEEGIGFAQSESASGKIVIETYMGQANDFSMTLLVLNGKVYPIRTVDRILGEYEDGLDKLAVGSVSPSVFTDLYLEKVHEKIDRFVKDIGLINAPIFMQGFVDGEDVRFYDPGLRLPGGEYERMFTYVHGRNPLYPLIEFSLTGEVSQELTDFHCEDVCLNHKVAVQILPTLKPGVIASIRGVEEIRNHSNVVSIFTRYKEGDRISESHNVGQRFCEIDIVCQTKAEIKEVVAWIYHTLKIRDENGNDMVTSKVNPEEMF